MILLGSMRDFNRLEGGLAALFKKEFLMAKNGFLKVFIVKKKI